MAACFRRFHRFTASGELPLPMAAELPASWTASEKAVGAEPLGLVTIGTTDRSILLTPDGVDWSLQAMPDGMVVAERRQPRRCGRGQ